MYIHLNAFFSSLARTALNFHRKRPKNKITKYALAAKLPSCYEKDFRTFMFKESDQASCILNTTEDTTVLWISWLFSEPVRILQWPVHYNGLHLGTTLHIQNLYRWSSKVNNLFLGFLSCTFYPSKTLVQAVESMSVINCFSQRSLWIFHHVLSWL